MQKSCINITNYYCIVNNWWRYKVPGHKGLVTPSGSQSSRPDKSYHKKTTRKEKQNTCPDVCFFFIFASKARRKEGNIFRRIHLFYLELKESLFIYMLWNGRWGNIRSSVILSGIMKSKQRCDICSLSKISTKIIKRWKYAYMDWFIFWDYSKCKVFYKGRLMKNILYFAALLSCPVFMKLEYRQCIQFVIWVAKC